jgi:hypothetical protein
MTDRAQRFIEEFEEGQSKRHGISNVLKHLAYAFGDEGSVSIEVIENLVSELTAPTLLDRALSGDGPAAREFLQDIGVIDSEGNLRPPYN